MMIMTILMMIIMIMTMITIIMLMIINHANNEYIHDIDDCGLRILMIIMKKVLITMMFRVLDRDSSGTIGFMELMLTIELVGAVK